MRQTTRLIYRYRYVYDAFQALLTSTSPSKLYGPSSKARNHTHANKLSYNILSTVDFWAIKKGWPMRSTSFLPRHVPRDYVLTVMTTTLWFKNWLLRDVRRTSKNCCPKTYLSYRVRSNFRWQIKATVFYKASYLILWFSNLRQRCWFITASVAFQPKCLWHDFWVQLKIQRRTHNNLDFHWI